MTVRTRSPESKASPELIRVRWDRRRVSLTIVLVGLLAVVPVAFVQADVLPGQLIAGISNIASLVERMLPVSFAGLPRLLRLLFETFLIAVAGTSLAILLSIPLAFLAARNTTPSSRIFPLARAVITLCRAVPDLVFAIIFVRALGLGVLPGVLALGLHSIGMVGKLFADSIEEVSPAPIEATRATGASWFQTITTAVVPQATPAFISAALYRLDINVRMSTVLGLVGAGGIGMDLQTMLRQFRYDRALGIIILVFILIVVMERMSSAVRGWVLTDASSETARFRGLGQARITSHADPTVRMPWTIQRLRMQVATVGAAALVAFSLVFLDIGPARIAGSVPEILRVATMFWPPDFATDLPITLRAVWESIMIAFVATFMGVILAFPFAFLGARNVAPNKPAYILGRYGVVAARGVPELVLAIVFVVAVGLGPFAGALALAISTVGISGKLMMDGIEQVSPTPVEALRATGAGRLQTVSQAVVPQALPNLVGTILYQLDINIRLSVVVGLVGAGGIGYLLQLSIQTLNYGRTSSILIIIFVVVYGIERLSNWVRSRLI